MLRFDGVDLPYLETSTIGRTRTYIGPQSINMAQLPIINNRHAKIPLPHIFRHRRQQLLWPLPLVPPLSRHPLRRHHSPQRQRISNCHVTPSELVSHGTS